MTGKVTGKIHFDIADTTDRKFDAPIEWLLIALLAFAPIALGATRAWSESIVILLATLMAILLALKLVCRPDVPFVRSGTYWPIALFVGWIALQLAPLPSVVVKIISPATFDLKQRLLSDLPDSAARLRWMTLSFYPEQTLHDLRMLVALASVFVVVVNCIRRMSQVRRILAAVAFIAAIIAIVALVQDAFGTTKIYGLFELPDETPARGGPFAIRGHFGQWMNLSIGAALGLALAQIHQHFRRDDHYSSIEVIQKLRSPALKPAWLILIAVILGTAAIVLSLSRGAIISLAIAGAIAGLLVGTRRGMHGRLWILAPAIICIAVVALLNLPRFTRQFDVSIAQARHDRLQAMSDLTSEWRRFPVTGAGLGTHAFVFPMFDRSLRAQFSNFAENDYAQLLTETGVIGFALAGAFVVLIVAASARAISGAISPVSSAALGLTFALIAILATGFVSSGQHAPAVAVLAAVVCALLVNLSMLRLRELDRVSSGLPSRGSWPARSLALLIVLAIGAGIVFDSYTAMRAELSWDTGQRAEAVRWRPKNIAYRFGLNQHRLESGEGAASIVDDLHDSAWLCPTHGPTYLLAYQIESKLPGFADAAARDIQFAFELSGPDAQPALLLGEFEIDASQPEAAAAHLRRAVAIDPDLSTQVMRLYISKMRRPDFALQAAGDDVDALTALANVLGTMPDQQSLLHDVRERAFAVLLAKAESPDAPAAIVARAADELAQRGQHERAIALFRRALALDYGQIDWRMKLAKSLEALGRDDEALHEAELCLRGRAQFGDAIAMVARIRQRKLNPASKPRD